MQRASPRVDRYIRSLPKICYLPMTDPAIKQEVIHNLGCFVRHIRRNSPIEENFTKAKKLEDYLMSTYLGQELVLTFHN